MEKNNRTKYTGPERRKYKRLNVFHLSTLVEIKTTPNDTLATGILLDISAGGIGILSFKEIPVGTIINLKLSLHNLETDNIKAKVVWTKENNKTYRIGIQFIEISKKDFEQIYNYVEEHLKEDM